MIWRLVIMKFEKTASRSLHLHQPRAWLRHTPYLGAGQTLKPMCRLKPTRMRAVHTRFAVQTIVLNFVSKHYLPLYLKKCRL